MIKSPSLAIALLFASGFLSQASACGEARYLGSICVTAAFRGCPNGYVLADGRIMPINQNPALFSLLGKTHGGDGITNFALPNLAGSSLAGAGQTPYGNNFLLGEARGMDAIARDALPLHSHSVPFEPISVQAATDGSDHLVIDVPKGGGTGTRLTDLAGSQVSEGAAQSPSLALGYCIAIEGTFPTQP